MSAKNLPDFLKEIFIFKVPISEKKVEFFDSISISIRKYVY